MPHVDSNPIQYIKTRLVRFDINGKIHYSLEIDGLFIDVVQPKNILGKIKDGQISFKRFFEADCPVKKHYHNGNKEIEVPIMTIDTLLSKEKES